MELKFPFVTVGVQKTYDISEDTKVISKLVAYEGLETVIDKIVITNPNKEPAVLSLLQYEQIENKETIQYKDSLGYIFEETTSPQIIVKQHFIHKGFLIPPETVKILEEFCDFVLAPNEYLGLKTDAAIQQVNCFVFYNLLQNCV